MNDLSVFSSKFVMRWAIMLSLKSLDNLPPSLVVLSSVLYVTDMIVDLEGEVASIVLWIDWYLVVFALVIDH